MVLNTGQKKGGKGSTTVGHFHRTTYPHKSRQDKVRHDKGQRMGSKYKPTGKKKWGKKKGPKQREKGKMRSAITIMRAWTSNGELQALI